MSLVSHLRSDGRSERHRVQGTYGSPRYRDLILISLLRIWKTVFHLILREV